MVQVDGAESGGPVDPGVACWVGMSGEPEAREERGLSPWQFAVRGATWSSAELALRSKPFGPVHSGAILYTLVHAWVGQIVTFFATAPPAAPWAP